MKCDRVWRGARLATMASGLGIVEKGVIASKDGRILYVGAESDAPTFDAAETIDCDGRWITPGLIDCHTHIVYGGNRAHEFELRLAGATYDEISRAGGGIVSTMRATRSESAEQLAASARKRIETLMRDGVTTLEIKSGYGLSIDGEMKSLWVARYLGRTVPISIATTFLGAHALPPEANGDKDAYITQVCEHQMPSVVKAGLADAVDAFCESIAFSPEQVTRVFETARKFGLPVKLHAEQLTTMGGAALAARFGALSADQLEQADEAGIQVGGRSGREGSIEGPASGRSGSPTSRSSNSPLTGSTRPAASWNWRVGRVSGRSD